METHKSYTLEWTEEIKHFVLFYIHVTVHRNRFLFK